MKKGEIILYCIIAVLFICNVFQYFSYNYPNTFTEVVPNEKVALEIAETVLASAYGEDVLLENKPLNAQYNNNKKVWTIRGSFREEENLVGGVAVISIRKQDGKITELYHGM